MSDTSSSYEPIAIVGRDVILPGASSPAALWTVVKDRQLKVESVPAGRFGLDPALVHGTPQRHLDRTWSTAGGYVHDDAVTGDFPGRDDVAPLDPLFRWVLGSSYRALADAGFDDGLGQDHRGGFIFGNLSYPTAAMARLGETLALPTSWRQALGRTPGDLRDRQMSGLPALLARKHLGLDAFAFCLDAACASSLYAVHLAARALQDHRADVVVAGAVNRADSLFLHVGFTALQALSQSGIPRPFDVAADGLVPAEGCVALTLMRLGDAVRDGRRIHGVIVGSALSNDGRQKSLLAPSSEGQARAVAGAWSAAGLNPGTAGFFECHATGTQAGDRTEVETLASVIDEGAPCIPLSSLKSNVGHLITAAGAAALVKVTEAMANETLPPSIGVQNPIAGLDGRRFRVQHDAAPWAAPADGAPRTAGVSAFGFGGNDAHVVVQAPQAPRFYASASLESSKPSNNDRDLVVVACAVRSGDKRGGLELLLCDADLGPATDVKVAVDGLKAPPNDLKCALGQQLLMLEAARDVVAHLGDDAAAALPSIRTGVMIGMGADIQVTSAGLRFRAEALANAAGVTDDATIAGLRDLAMAPMGPASVLGMMPNIPANRLNVQLDLRGAGFTVSSEQASGTDSLEAARALLCAGDLDAAIVGAVEAGNDARHLAALGVAEGTTGVDVAVAMVVMRPGRAAALGLAAIATLKSPDVHAEDDAMAVNAGHVAARGAQAAAGMVALGAAIAGASRDGAIVSVIDDATRATRAVASVAPVVKRPAPRVALGFGPVMSGTQPLDARFRRIPAVAHALRRYFGSDDDVSAIADGGRGAPGCERDLFVGASAMLARAAFVTDVLGVDVGHHLGVSLGESASLVAAGVWRDPRALLEETVASRLFVDEVAGARGAVEALWDSRGVSELERAWATAVVRAPRDQIEEAIAEVKHATVTMWHTDDEAEIAGAPKDVIAVAAAVGATPVFLPDAPTVHGPAIAAVADRYRALHRRVCFPKRTDLTLWSCGAGDSADVPGVLDDVSADGCADAITRQAARTVDVPALVRAARAAGVDTLIDVSPRGLLGMWATRIAPALRVIIMDGDPVVVARAAAAAGLTSSRHFMTSHIDEVSRSVTIPAHTPPQAWPAPVKTVAPITNGAGPEKMMPAPKRPRISTVERAAPKPLAKQTMPPPQKVATPSAPTPAPAPAPMAPTMTSAPVQIDDAPTPTSDGADGLIDALRVQRAALAAIHQSFVSTASAAHQDFLASRARLQSALLIDGHLHAEAGTAQAAPPAATTTTAWSAPAPAPASAPAPAPAPTPAPTSARMPTTSTAPRASEAPKATGPVLFDRRALESLATDKISAVLGPMFARQDVFPRQVRMPEPPLLLCDRVLSTTATPGVLEKGRMMFTATDVRADAWYLHEGRVPAGILIETGQADLLLISMMGVDFENKGERCYRLLGCDLTYTDELPLVGQTLHHSISIDGFATAAISAASEARIFFFHSDTRLGDENGPIVLSVRNGQAGFFTDEELLHSGGVLWKPADNDEKAIAALPHAPPTSPTTKTAFTRQELEAWSQGQAYRCFGAGFELCQTQVRTPRIDPPRAGDDVVGNPDGRPIDMLLMDRVTQLDLEGGPWGRGYLRAELDLSAEKWFYDGHFKDDPCMPGTVMFQGCLQAASLVLAARGDIIDRDGFRFEPKHDAQMRLRCRGQATPTSKHMVYEVFVSQCTDGREPELRCDILVTVDGLKSLHCADLVLKLAADYPLSGRPDLMGITPKTDGRDAVSPSSVFGELSKQPVLGFQSLMSTGVGRPGAAFPGLYDVYDDGSPVARMPGPPYHFMSNVDAVGGPPMGSMHNGQSPAGTNASVRYDVPHDAWYFDEAQRSQGGTMPFAVLLEVALQPCGWLSSYVGSTRTSEAPLKYRNLDGKATQHREVGRDVGALITTATLTKSSASGGMIIQDFSFETKTAAGEPVFSGTTVFGFFPQLALERQVGVGSSDDDKARLVAPSAVPGFPMAFAHDSTWARLQPSRLTLPAPVGAPPLLMIDRVEGAWRTDKGHLRVRTSKDVVLDDWFFKAHFFRDPVQPGSLGIEAMVQALQFAAAFDDVGAAFKNPRFESLATGAPLTWKYRGQVVPKNTLIQVEAEVTDIVRDERGVTVVGDGALWVDGLRIYLAKGLAIRIVEG
jgi:acyl transferase domain-containing protein/3-hydroxymyristoyl/3-hydroxydecanoyl-(acyl carrier protein) dehydratase